MFIWGSDTVGGWKDWNCWNDGKVCCGWGWDWDLIGEGDWDWIDCGCSCDGGENWRCGRGKEWDCECGSGSGCIGCSCFDCKGGTWECPFNFGWEFKLIFEGVEEEEGYNCWPELPFECGELIIGMKETGFGVCVVGWNLCLSFFCISLEIMEPAGKGEEAGEVDVWDCDCVCVFGLYNVGFISEFHLTNPGLGALRAWVEAGSDPTGV